MLRVGKTQQISVKSREDSANKCKGQECLWFFFVIIWMYVPWFRQIFFFVWWTISRVRSISIFNMDSNFLQVATRMTLLDVRVRGISSSCDGVHGNQFDSGRNLQNHVLLASTSVGSSLTWQYLICFEHDCALYWCLPRWHSKLFFSFSVGCWILVYTIIFVWFTWGLVDIKFCGFVYLHFLKTWN